MNYKELSWILLFFLFFITICHSTNNDECLRIGQFENVGKGFALTGHVISSLQVPDLFECSFACLQEYRCVSYNFQEVPNPLQLCQLSSERRDTKPGDYQLQADMTYYDANKPQKGPGCASSPCHNGAKCISTCHRIPFSFRCACNEPHFGEFCQNWKDSYDLIFPTSHVSNYVNSSTLSNFFTAFTLCIWFQTTQGGTFGLVTGLISIVCADSGQCNFQIEGSSRARFYGAPLNDGMWHSLCITWTSAGGNWSAYVDGKTNPRRSDGKLRNNYVVQFIDEQLVLGQDVQDGAFKEGRSFTGNISRVNMWNYSMTEEELQIIATNCSSPLGNVLKWRDFWKGLQGGVELSGESQCTGADNSSTVSLNFIGLTTVNYVKYSKPLPSFQHFTLCHWTKLSQMGNFATVLSYANSDSSNALFISFRKDVGVWILLNNNYLKLVSTPLLALQHWHHVCITWTNVEGVIKCYIDGLLKREHTNYKKDNEIKGGGVLVLGQDQDSVGGGFQSTQSFAGVMSHVNMWNYVLNPFSLVDMATGFGNEKGNLLSWRVLLDSQINGAVRTVPIADDPPKQTTANFKFVFPSRSVDNYVKLQSATSGPSLSYVTACVWVKVAQASPMALFNYKTSGHYNALSLIAKDTGTFTFVVSSTWKNLAYGDFLSHSGWQHVCLSWGTGGSWNLFFNGVIRKSGISEFAIGKTIPSGGNLFIGVRRDGPNEFKSDQLLKGEISHLNIWDKRLDQDSRVIPAMYRGCDETGGNWLHWSALSQASLMGNVTKSTPAECILPDEIAAEERNQFCEVKTKEGCTAPVYALFGGTSSSRSKRWRCYFSEAVLVSGLGHLQYDFGKGSSCYITITEAEFFDII